MISIETLLPIAVHIVNVEVLDDVPYHARAGDGWKPRCHRRHFTPYVFIAGIDAVQNRFRQRQSGCHCN